MFEIIGFLAAILTTISFLPQAVKIIKTKDTSSISLTMYVIFTTGVLCWLVYGIHILNWAVLLANGVTAIFSIIILTYKLIDVINERSSAKTK
jgi:MtN3 and saliva related transmembrane protein